MTNTKPIIFMHMMKTGGLTMVNILREAFGVDHTFKLGNTHGDRTNYLPDLVTTARNPEMRIFIGHFGWGVQQLFDRHVQFITILRHPVDRVLSLSRYLGVTALDFSTLSRLLTETPEARNGMVRRLNGLTSVDLSKGVTRDVSWRDMSTTDIQVNLTDQHLEAAKQVLNEFAAIGMQEMFAETLLLFRDKLNSPPLFSIQRPFLNHAASPLSRAGIDPRVTSLIVDHNRLDLDLYQLCREQFDNQIADLEQRRSTEMAVQRLLNDGLAQRGKQVLEESEAFATLQVMINKLVQSEKLAEASCLLCYILSKPLDRDTAAACLSLLQKIGEKEDVEREKAAFKRQFG